MKDSHWAFKAMAAIAVVILLVCVGLQIWGAVKHVTIEIPHSVFYVAMLLGFVGFYGLDPKRAKDGGSFIVESTTRLVSAVRFGRRSSDNIAAVVSSTTTTKMPSADDPPVKAD